MSRATELLEQATPLPWYWDVQEQQTATKKHYTATLRSSTALNEPAKALGMKLGMSVVQHESWYVQPAEADRELIVYAVNTLPVYEAAVEALERLMNEWLRQTAMTEGAYQQAHAALSRLRDKVPA